MSSDILRPRDVVDLEQAIRWALGEGKALELVGRGTKRAIGRAAQWDMTLDLSAFSGITLYEPAELVLSAKAGDAARRDRGAAGQPTARSWRSSRWTTASFSAARRRRHASAA